jgi:DNA-binding Lrp family transcriptional regulator
MQQKILSLLKENARISLASLSVRTGLSEEDVALEIKKLESAGIIRGYTAILNENAENTTAVKAIIEVKVTPKREGGFDQVARRIANYPEVTDLMLVSGSFDLLLTVQGNSLNEVANFVASKLATIDGVISTSTSFMLRKYKESGRVMEDNDEYERLKICP